MGHLKPTMLLGLLVSLNPEHPREIPVIGVESWYQRDVDSVMLVGTRDGQVFDLRPKLTVKSRDIDPITKVKIWISYDL